MKRLERVLRGLLLLGAPFTQQACLMQSSCPDDGYDPPVVTSKKVDAALADGGPLSAAQCQQVCNEGSDLITCVRESAELVLCLNRQYLCEGRRPAGLEDAEHRGSDGFGRHLAEGAWLEAASINAFRQLRLELRAHGAPRRLLRAASRSARDERRHARASKALARRFGVAVPSVRQARPEPRSLLALALENVVEGCVRETWGALIALRQAARAAEPSVRATVSRIAPDELRHAELAWSVQRWLTPRLSPHERGQVRAARDAALAELRRDGAGALSLNDRRRLGYPSAEECAALLDAFTAELTRTSN